MNTVKEINATTGKEIERPMTPEELAYWESTKFDAQKEKEKEVAKQALLDRLGISADELKLLLG